MDDVDTLTHDEIVAELGKLRLDGGGSGLHGGNYVTGAVVLLTTRYPDGMDGLVLVNSEGLGGFAQLGVLHAALQVIAGEPRS